MCQELLWNGDICRENTNEGIANPMGDEEKIILTKKKVKSLTAKQLRPGSLWYEPKGSYNDQVVT